MANDLVALCRCTDGQPSPYHVSRQPMVVPPQSCTASAEWVLSRGGKPVRHVFLVRAADFNHHDHVGIARSSLQTSGWGALSPESAIG